VPRVSGVFSKSPPPASGVKTSPALQRAGSIEMEFCVSHAAGVGVGWGVGVGVGAGDERRCHEGE
jgi:hypothetical protein